MANPFTLTFGKKPTEYITRYDSIDEIVSSFCENPPRCQTYLVMGVRGSGKTVLMTSIAKELSQEEEWVCVDLNSTRDLIDDFAFRLADACANYGDILDRGFDLSFAGFGVGVGEKAVGDSISRCEKILNMLSKKNKKILISIDEVNNSESMKQFASQFQIWIRKDYPIFLLMTGLHENLNAIQNNPQLTFLLRSPKIALSPLGIVQISRQYEEILSVSTEEALQLAKITKGYAFGFQALGLLLWNKKDSMKLDDVLKELDNLLDDYVYRKIWSDLSQNERKILLNMSDDSATKISDIYTAIEMSPQSFSKYRERLINKGLVTSSGYGYLELSLPRFGGICRMYGAVEM